GIYAAISFDANVNAACTDPSGNLVVGTHGSGIYWFEADGNCRHIGVDEGLPPDSHGIVLSLCFDREGNLWAGTDGGGLTRIRHKVFIAPNGLSAGVAQSVSEDETGGMWVAFNSRGLTYWRTNAATDYGIGTSSNAWTVLVDDHQRVWAGTRGEGLFRLMSHYFQPVSAAEPVGRQIYVLFQGRDGKIWAGGENGLGSYDGSAWKFYSERDGLPPNAVRALAEDENGGLWIGTEGGGLFQLRGSKIVPVNSPVRDISCLLADSDGVLWVGTSGHGLARLHNGGWKVCSTLDGGLAGDSVNYLVDDQAGNLWVGSYEGLMRVEKKSVADFVAGAVKTISCRTFLTRECSAGAQPAGMRAGDGRLWFPTIHGVATVNPADLKPNTNLPPVVIESVLVDGARVNTNLLSTVAGG
ncbi:MAG TPA: two-component regulator propeller domain-containing protein, partial [Candidatus Binatia bacterium]|nr:two-component regulator propeller domain-containing protein [Candidatus Binatia bacterium]